MNVKILCAVLSVIMLAGSCTSTQEPEGERVFTRFDFKETKMLDKVQEIVIDSLLYPASFRVMNDTLLVVSNQPICDYQLEVYSLNTLRPVAQLIRKGNGPGEMLSCAANLHSGLTPEFYLTDGMMQTCYAVCLDSLLKDHSFRPLSSFCYSSEVLSNSEVCDWDADHYVGCNMWYSPDERYDNGCSAPVSVYRKNEKQGNSPMSYKYFTAPVNGCLLFRNPKSGRLWTADMHRDVISVYDDSLNVVSTFVGPDRMKAEYETVQSNLPMAFVSFTEKRDLRSYTDYWLTDKHVYLLYEGTEHFDPMNLTPTEVFKLDYSGNLVACYQFDRYVYSISVDSKEDYLYCASRKNVQEPPVLLKYKL